MGTIIPSVPIQKSIKPLHCRECVVIRPICFWRQVARTLVAMTIFSSSPLQAQNEEAEVTQNESQQNSACQESSEDCQQEEAVEAETVSQGKMTRYRRKRSRLTVTFEKAPVPQFKLGQVTF